MPLMLTFDDGPDPVWTPRLLDVLADGAARATFFPIAFRAAAQPELIARMRAEGHRVGLHCHEHARHSLRSAAWGREDAAHALTQLASVGVKPTLWRTPWGDTAGWTKPLAREHGLTLVPWTVDTHDWRGDSAETMFQSTVGGLRSGAIVLAHDGVGPGALRAHARETIEYTSRVIAHAQAEKLELEAVA
ncbi:MAG: polysaccharide deacetylase family protein [Actinomycetota bacterium]|nr:polysaccharide deacetylase family protein [Actinomycetota bacterium]